MILKLEDQCCSLESAKRLKELGCPQESLFYWRKYQNWLIDLGTNCPGEWGWTDEEVDETSAYTTAELGELLPMEISDGTYDSGRISGANDWWFCGYGDAKRKAVNVFQTATTEAESKAKMLIYLLENKLIGVPIGGKSL